MPILDTLRLPSDRWRQVPSTEDLSRKLHQIHPDARPIAVVRFTWKDQGRQGDPAPWPGWAVQYLLDLRGEVPGQRLGFRPLHDLSVAGFWRASTLGLLEASFDLYPKDGSTLTLDARRDSLRNGEPDQKALAATEAFFLGEGIPIDSFDGIVYWVDPPTADWGAIDCPPEGRGRSQRAMLHQMLAHRTFCHEIGHVLGYQHAFDIENPSDPVYRDDFCVMGQDNVGSWWMPANAAMDRLEHDPGLTLATHLAAAASSYRHCRPFRTSLGVREVSPTIPEEAELVSLSRATFGDRVLLVVRDAGAFFVVEYRTNVGWDTGVSSAVVVHSLGLRANPPGFGEDRPVWFETAIYSPWTDVYRAPSENWALQVLAISEDGRTARIRSCPPDQLL